MRITRPLAWRRVVMFLLFPLWFPLLAVGFVARFAWIFITVGWDALADFLHWINEGNDG